MPNFHQDLYAAIVEKWQAFQANLKQQQQQQQQESAFGSATLPTLPTETEEESAPDACPTYQHHAAIYGQEFLVNGRSMENLWVGTRGWKMKK